MTKKEPNHGLARACRQLFVAVAFGMAVARIAVACGLDGPVADTGRPVYPIPISPLWNTRDGADDTDEDASPMRREAYDLTPVLPPKPPGGPTAPVQPPTRQEIARALQESDKSFAGQSLDALESRIKHVDVQTISQSLDPPRIFPLVGLAQVSHKRFKCTVCLRSAAENPKQAAGEQRFDTRVVDIEHTHLHMVVEDDKKDAPGK